MPRNLDARIEVITPVEDPLLVAEIDASLDLMLADTAGCWTLDGDGAWHRRRPQEPGVPPFSSQAALMERARRAGRRRGRRRSPRGGGGAAPGAPAAARQARRAGLGSLLMAKARRVRIDPDAPFAAAASETVKVRGPELLEFLEGTLDGSDIEQLHSMRVASRRLRAALEVYEGCFDKKPHRRLLRLVKDTADALSEARDLDVQIDYLTGYRAQVPAADRAGHRQPDHAAAGAPRRGRRPPRARARAGSTTRSSRSR